MPERVAKAYGRALPCGFATTVRVTSAFLFATPPSLPCQPLSLLFELTPTYAHALDVAGITAATPRRIGAF